MSGFRLPLALSLAAHVIALGLLLLLPAPPADAPAASGGIEVAFVPSLPRQDAPPAQQPVKAGPPSPQSEPPPQVKAPPPSAPPIAPPPPAPAASVVVPEPMPLPPPPKPPVPPPRRPAIQQAARLSPRPAFAAAPPVPAGPGAWAAPTQQAMAPPARVPPPAPSAAVSPGYGALLGAWLNSHKRYPESARERGEEGRVVLRFAVERSGRVEQFAVIQSSGYPDLDAAVKEMMRGAILPPFPADMPQASVTVSVTIRFSLEH